MVREEDLAQEHAPEEIGPRSCLDCKTLFSSLSRFNRRCNECHAKGVVVGPLFDAPRLKRPGHRHSAEDAA